MLGPVGRRSGAGSARRSPTGSWWCCPPSAPGEILAGPVDELERLLDGADRRDRRPGLAAAAADRRDRSRAAALRRRRPGGGLRTGRRAGAAPPPHDPAAVPLRPAALERAGHRRDAPDARHRAGQPGGLRRQPAAGHPQRPEHGPAGRRGRPQQPAAHPDPAGDDAGPDAALALGADRHRARPVLAALPGRGRGDQRGARGRGVPEHAPAAAGRGAAAGAAAARPLRGPVRGAAGGRGAPGARRPRRSPSAGAGPRGEGAGHPRRGGGPAQPRRRLLRLAPGADRPDRAAGHRGRRPRRAGGARRPADHRGGAAAPAR